MTNQTSPKVSFAQGSYAEISRGDQWLNFLSIDLDNENGPIVFVESNFGHGCSMQSFNGFEVSLAKLPNDLTESGVQMVFDELKDRFEQELLTIFNDCEKTWNGSNHVCRLGKDANEALLLITDYMENYIDSGLPCYWSASDYFQDSSPYQIGKAWINSDHNSILTFWGSEYESSDFVVEEEDAIRYLRNELQTFLDEDLEEFVNDRMCDEAPLPLGMVEQIAKLKEVLQ